MNAFDSEVVVRLRALFSNATPGRAPAPEDSTEPFIEVGVRAGEMFTIAGEGFYLLEDLAEELATPAATGGLSVSSVRDALLGAAGEWLRSGEAAAFEYLQQRLDVSASTWLIVRPIRSDQQVGLLSVGRCTFQRGLPAQSDSPWPSHYERHFPHFSVATHVQARDSESAKAVAAQNVAEALAILRLTRWSWRGRADLGEWVAMKGENLFRLETVGVSVQASSMVDQSGRFWPHLDALSAAAAKPSDAQTDWERRTLAAARWLDEGTSSSWPSDSLVAMMVALEALFVRGKSQSKKGAVIAAEVSDRWRIGGMTREQQVAWLNDLYAHRNEAVHEGRHYENEINVSRLHVLCWQAVSWATGHLRPLHGLKSSPCVSQVEALSDHSKA